MYDHFVLNRLVGESPWAERTRCRILQLAQLHAPVLIVGDQGTGKQLIARAIHFHSSRANAAFIPFQAARLQGAMAMCQLFGQLDTPRGLSPVRMLGCVGSAAGGTLLIEEIGELDWNAQCRLLDLLRNQQGTASGETDGTEGDSHGPDFCLIATTSRDLGEDVVQGRFHAELYALLAQTTIKTRPLAERVEDIMPLVRHTLARITLERGTPLQAICPAVVALLECYDWPSNVDELEQMVESALDSSTGATLDVEDFPYLMDQMPSEPHEVIDGSVDEPERVNALEVVPSMERLVGRWPSLQEMEAEHLRVTLRRCNHRLPVAARMLGLTVPQLREKLNLHGLRGHSRQEVSRQD